MIHSVLHAKLALQIHKLELRLMGHKELSDEARKAVQDECANIRDELAHLDYGNLMEIFMHEQNILTAKSMGMIP